MGGHTYVYQRREYLSGSSRGHGRDGCCARGGRGGRGHQAGRHSDNASQHADERNVAAANVTDIVEYNASNSTQASQSTALSDRGG